MALDLQSTLVGAVVTATLGVFGYFGRSILPGERSRSKASLLSSYANIASVMREQGLSIDDIEGVSAQFSAQKRRERAIETDYSKGVHPFWTQAAMNQRAHSTAAESEARLDSAVLSLRQILSEEEQDSFEACQDAWMTFRTKQAEFAAAEFAGGSMAPSIYSSEISDVTDRRTRELRAIFDQRAKQDL